MVGASAWCGKSTPARAGDVIQILILVRNGCGARKSTFVYGASGKIHP